MPEAPSLGQTSGSTRLVKLRLGLRPAVNVPGGPWSRHIRKVFIGGCSALSTGQFSMGPGVEIEAQVRYLGHVNKLLSNHQLSYWPHQLPISMPWLLAQVLGALPDMFPDDASTESFNLPLRSADAALYMV